MRKVLTLILTTGVLLGSPSLDAAAGELATVEKRILKQWNKHKSITAKLKTVTRMDMGAEVHESEGRGTYQVVKKDDKTLFRHYYERRIVTKVGDRRKIVDQKNMRIMDGEYLYRLIEIMGRKAASILSDLHCWVEFSQLDSGVGGGESPVDARMPFIS